MNALIKLKLASTAPVYETVYENIPWLAPFIKQCTFYMDAIRGICWEYSKACMKAVTALYQGFIDLFTIDPSSLPFVASAEGIVGKIVPALMILFLAIAAVALMLGKERPRKELASGLAISFLLILLTPYTMFTMHTLTESVTTGMTAIFSTNSGVYEDTDIGKTILESGVVDILTSAEKSDITYLDQDPYSIDINEKIGGWFGHADIFPDKVYGSDGSSAWGAPLVADNIILPNLTNESLYRYDLDYFQICLLTTVLIISIILGGIRAAATIFEIIFNQIVAPLVYATDIMNQGRAKEFFQRIISTYLSLMVICFTMLMYVRMTAWVMDNEWNWWLKFFLVVGFTMAMFNGPDSIIKIIGIDTGTRSGAAPFVSTAALISQAVSMVSLASQRSSGSGNSNPSNTGRTGSAEAPSASSNGATPEAVSEGKHTEVATSNNSSSMHVRDRKTKSQPRDGGSAPVISAKVAAETNKALDTATANLPRPGGANRSDPNNAGSADPSVTKSNAGSDSHQSPSRKPYMAPPDIAPMITQATSPNRPQSVLDSIPSPVTPPPNTPPSRPGSNRPKGDNRR